ncbi:MAG: hypothetical protein DCC58_00070 [Chloroflexi bacterium]|nr:MAG: hypothetical protein DCC58_00070 [Chloroflexota bacterium]
MPFQDILQSLSLDRAWQHLETITTDIPSRLAGSENARRMAEYADAEQRAAGLASRTTTFPGLVSFPEPAVLRILEPEPLDIEAFTLAQSQTAALDGELIDLGPAGWADYAGQDVRGKIVLAELPYAPARHEKALIAWRAGARGLITANWGDEQCEAIAFGSIKSPWGNPTPEALERDMPQLPAASISRRDGLRLQRMCASGPVRVHLATRAENGWRPVTMTSGEIDAGTSEFLLVGGHMDSWFGPQATDNAAGSACILELARVFQRAASRGELRRGLHTGFWMAHETGTMISSTRYADVHWDRLRRDCVGYLQIDQPGIAETSVFQLHSTEDLREWLTRVTSETLGNMPLRWGRQSKNGDSSFFGVGLSCLAGLLSFTHEEIAATALANLGWYHHSIHNTLDRVAPDRLELCLRVYARWIWELLTLPVLPIQQAPVAAALLARLNECAAQPIDDIDMAGAVERARAYAGLATRLDAAADLARQLPPGSEQEQRATHLNAAMLATSRVLVPLASTVVGAYGQDRYGHAWQRNVIPALTPWAAVAGADRDSEAFATGWVELVRARNRVVDALDAASSIAERAMAPLAT